MAKAFKRQIPYLQIFSVFVIGAGLLTATALVQQPQKPNTKAAVNISCGTNTSSLSCQNVPGCYWQKTKTCADISSADCNKYNCALKTVSASCVGLNETTCGNTSGCTKNYTTQSGTCSGSPPCSNGCTVANNNINCTFAGGCNQAGCIYKSATSGYCTGSGCPNYDNPTSCSNMDNGGYNCTWVPGTLASCNGSYIYSQYCKGTFSQKYYSGCSGNYIATSVCRGVPPPGDIYECIGTPGLTCKPNNTSCTFDAECCSDECGPNNTCITKSAIIASENRAYINSFVYGQNFVIKGSGIGTTGSTTPIKIGYSDKQLLINAMLYQEDYQTIYIPLTSLPGFLQSNLQYLELGSLRITFPKVIFTWGTNLVLKNSIFAPIGSSVKVHIEYGTQKYDGQTIISQEDLQVIYIPLANLPNYSTPKLVWVSQ